MKIYLCKICEDRGKRFSGTRKTVRDHLKEVHLIRKRFTASTISLKFK